MAPRRPRRPLDIQPWGLRQNHTLSRFASVLRPGYTWPAAFQPDIRDVVTMSTIQEIENAVRNLSPDDLGAFRLWFAEFDADIWDRQFEQDVAAGRLDKLANEALTFRAVAGSTGTLPCLRWSRASC